MDLTSNFFVLCSNMNYFFIWYIHSGWSLASIFKRKGLRKHSNSLRSIRFLLLEKDDLRLFLFTHAFHIGITHVFSCVNICRVPRMLFEHEADRPSVQTSSEDPASVNAMKQTCVIVILAYYTLFQPNSH